MRCKERIFISNVSLRLSMTRGDNFCFVFPPPLFFCFLYLWGESGALWQNFKAGERTDVLWWLMCFSSPLKSRAFCTLLSRVTEQSPSPSLHPVPKSQGHPPALHLAIEPWWDGRWDARFGQWLGMIMCFLNTRCFWMLRAGWIIHLPGDERG